MCSPCTVHARCRGHRCHDRRQAGHDAAQATATGGMNRGRQARRQLVQQLSSLPVEQLAHGLPVRQIGLVPRPRSVLVPGKSGMAHASRYWLVGCVHRYETRMHLVPPHHTPRRRPLFPPVTAFLKRLQVLGRCCVHVFPLVMHHGAGPGPRPKRREKGSWPGAIWRWERDARRCTPTPWPPVVV